MKRVHWSQFIGILALVGCVASQPVDARVARKFKKLDSEIRTLVDESDIVGGEILIVKSGKVLYHEAHGWRDVEKEKPMDRNTICRIRSMTKPIVGTCVLMLYEQGKLSMTDKVCEYIPAYDNEACREITVEQLMLHTGGFRQPGYPGMAQDYSSLEALIEALTEAGPTYEPGERYSYSDGGSSTLAAIVTKVSGMPVEDFIQDKIFDPLGMEDSFCYPHSDDPRMARVSSTYFWNDSSSAWIKYWDSDEPFAVPFFRGSGGVFTTTSDYVKFLRMWMNDGLYRGKRILKPETIEMALTPSGLSGDRPYGYHMGVYKGVGFGHSGSDGTLGVAVPGEDLIFCYFTQSRGNRTLRDMRLRIFDLFSIESER